MISVALCTYNGELYIKEQLLSIINQTILVDEIIVRDDGSFDSTIEIIKEISANHPEITFNIKQSQNNIGVVKNFENAINDCSGEIIILSDQDDIWFPNKAEQITKWFYDHPEKDTLFSNAILINSKNEQITQKTLWDCVGFDSKSKQFFDRCFFTESILTTNRITGATMAIRNRKVSFENIGDIVLHDEALALEALAKKTLGYLDYCLTQYRIHGNQTIGIGHAIGHQWSNNISEPPKTGIRRFLGTKLEPLFADRLHFRLKRERIRNNLFTGEFLMVFNLTSYIKMYERWFLQVLWSDIIKLYSNRKHSLIH